jgi:hypothetical protein
MNIANVIAPRVRMRYRQPQLSALVHGAPGAQEKLGINAHATMFPLAQL